MKTQILNQKGLIGILLVAGMLTVSGQTALANEAQVNGTNIFGKDFQNNRFERLKAFLDKHPGIKEKIDQNGDGRIDETERENAKQVLKKQRNERFQQLLQDNPQLKQRLDLNGDGQIDLQERKQARASFAEHKKERMVKWAENHPERAGRIDRNNNDQIDPWERRRAKQAHDTADRNDDGRVDRVERAKYKDQFIPKYQPRKRRNHEDIPG